MKTSKFWPIHIETSRWPSYASACPTNSEDMSADFVRVCEETYLAITMPALLRISLFPVTSQPFGTFLWAFRFGSISCLCNHRESLMPISNSQGKGLRFTVGTWLHVLLDNCEPPLTFLGTTFFSAWKVFIAFLKRSLSHFWAWAPFEDWLCCPPRAPLVNKWDISFAIPCKRTKKAVRGMMRCLRRRISQHARDLHFLLHLFLGLQLCLGHLSPVWIEGFLWNNVRFTIWSYFLCFLEPHACCTSSLQVQGSQVFWWFQTVVCNANRITHSFMSKRNCETSRIISDHESSDPKRWCAHTRELCSRTMIPKEKIKRVLDSPTIGSCMPGSKGKAMPPPPRPPRSICPPRGMIISSSPPPAEPLPPGSMIDRTLVNVVLCRYIPQSDCQFLYLFHLSPLLLLRHMKEREALRGLVSLASWLAIDRWRRWVARPTLVKLYSFRAKPLMKMKPSDRSTWSMKWTENNACQELNLPEWRELKQLLVLYSL